MKKILFIWILAALWACSSIDDAHWDNPRDPQGDDYHPPTVILSDTSFFKNDSAVRLIVRTHSVNSQITDYAWTLNGEKLQRNSDTLLVKQWPLGKHVLMVQVTDNNGLQGMDTASIAVLNRVPELITVSDTVLASGEVLQLTLRASDQDGKIQKFQWDSGGSVYADSNIRLPERVVGNLSIHWNAEDNDGAVVSDSFVVQWGVQDVRDKKSYSSARLGSELWMMRNLDYKADSSWCYENKEENCNTDGRLYRWNTALSVCPAGWRLPSAAEWQALPDSVELASRWGGAYDGNAFYYQGQWAFWWTATEHDVYHAQAARSGVSAVSLHLDKDDKSTGYSVRCILDRVHP